jgi:hypothetical protein
LDLNKKSMTAYKSLLTIGAISVLIFGVCLA